ncbi:hypothetical protein JW859_01895 [bacterium]|nr:hypothetical protein [bacterium]
MRNQTCLWPLLVLLCCLPVVIGSCPKPSQSDQPPTDAAQTTKRLTPAPQAAPAAAETSQPTVDDPAAAWREDLEFLAAELPARHIDFFAQLERADWEEAVAELDSELDGLSEPEIVMRLMYLVAMAGDSHTALDVSQAGFHAFPLQLYWFEDGLWVMTAPQEHADIIGWRLVDIDGTEAAEAAELVSQLYAYENYSQYVKMAPNYLVVGELLHALDITDSAEEATFTFEDDFAEQRQRVKLTAVGSQNKPQLVSWLENFNHLPIYLEQTTNPYFCKYLPDERMLFLQYNACVERSELPLADFAGMVSDMVGQFEFDTFVVDLRFNGGGDSALAQPLLDLIATDPRINVRDRLFVVIGRNTFSSAVLNALELRRRTEALFVGEPTGGKPNHFGELQTFKLPNSGLMVYYSTKYFTNSDVDTDSLEPDIPAVEFSADILGGYDPALIEIENYRAGLE